MGNVSGREMVDNGGDDSSGRSDGGSGFPATSNHIRRDTSLGAAAMVESPPGSPCQLRTPLLFGPQMPIAPLQRPDVSPVVTQMWTSESQGSLAAPAEKGIPTLISWNQGGNDVSVEGSWDNWTTRKPLHRSGKDHTILLVLPAGVYHCKFLVDGEWRYIPDLPFVADELGNITNLLDVHDYVPENFESIAEFESPPSPTSSYSQPFPLDEDFAKEPPATPPQLHLTVLGTQSAEEAATKPQHVVLNHLFIEKGWGSQSLVALGLTHRFQSKYVTVMLYKPMRR